MHVRRDLPASRLREFHIVRAATTRLCQIHPEAEPQPGEDGVEVQEDSHPKRESVRAENFGEK